METAMMAFTLGEIDSAVLALNQAFLRLDSRRMQAKKADTREMLENQAQEVLVLQSRFVKAQKEVINKKLNKDIKDLCEEAAKHLKESK